MVKWVRIKGSEINNLELSMGQAKMYLLSRQRRWVMMIENNCFSSFYCLLLQNLNRKSMFVVLHSDINSLKPDLLHLTGQPFCKKGRSAKVKDAIMNYSPRNYIVDLYIV